MQKQAEDDRQKLPEVLRRIAVGEAFTEKADAAKDRLASLLQTQTILSEQLAALKTRSDAAKAEAQCKKLWGAAEDAARTARLTVVGQDKVGIIAAVCALLAEHNVNILDISQTILQGSFTMVMAVDVGAAKVSVGELRDLLEQLGQKMEISIRIQREEIFDAMHRI